MIEKLAANFSEALISTIYLAGLVTLMVICLAVIVLWFLVPFILYNYLTVIPNSPTRAVVAVVAWVLSSASGVAIMRTLTATFGG